MEFINYVASMRKWTALMDAIPVGTTTVRFTDIGAIKAFKASAYDRNSDGGPFSFGLSVDKKNLSVTITKRVNY